MYRQGNEFFRTAMESIPLHLRDVSLREWEPTPFMIDVNVGDADDEIMRWLRLNLGYESSPMHRREGVWKRASVTMNGCSWFGFKTQALLDRFITAKDNILTPRNQ